jgi:hypothetical protein
MDITVVCRPNEVDVEPGGYRITTTTLSSTKLLAERLAAIARSAESGNGEVARRPRLKFLIEPGGEATFLDARRQTTYSDFDWPTTLQVTEGTRVRNPLGLSGFES